MKWKKTLTVLCIALLSVMMLSGCSDNAKKLLKDAIAKNNTLKAVENKLVFSMDSNVPSMAALSGMSYTMDSITVKTGDNALIGDMITVISVSAMGQEVEMGNMYIKDLVFYFDLPVMGMKYYAELPDEIKSQISEMGEEAAIAMNAIDWSSLFKDLKSKKVGNDTVISFSVNSDLIQGFMELALESSGQEVTDEQSAQMLEAFKNIKLNGTGTFTISSEGYVIGTTLELLFTDPEDTNQTITFHVENVITPLADNYKLEFPDFDDFVSYEELENSLQETPEEIEEIEEPEGEE